MQTSDSATVGCDLQMLHVFLMASEINPLEGSVELDMKQSMAR